MPRPRPETPAVSSAAKPVVRVSVRDLVDLVWRQGDLGGERDFFGPQRSLAGIRGHQQVQRSRPPGYRREVAVGRDLETPEFLLRVEGRVDGFLAAGQSLLVEEIKTVQTGWDGRPDPVHWAQARVYAFLLTADHPTDPVQVQLTYLNVDSGAVTEFLESADTASLAAFFETTTESYLEWIQAHLARNRDRNLSLQTLEFPFPAYRPGQRELMVRIYRAIQQDRRLFIEAPTGIGKTISAVFPALKALAAGRIERLFYLTARGTGQTAAQTALRQLRQTGLVLRSLTLTAREKLCVREGQPCDLRSCPLALGYYDRRRPAMAAALQSGEIDRATLEQLAQQFQVCPAELGLDLSVWVDAIICDYNYIFDPRAYLRRHLTDPSNPILLLVDEAHNLVDRARQMFSADVSLREIREVQSALKHAAPRCFRALSKLSTTLRRLAKTEPGQTEAANAPAGQPELFDAPPSPPSSAPSVAIGPGGEPIVLRELPAELPSQLDQALEHAAAWLARNEPAEFRRPLLDLYFRLFAIRRTAEAYDAGYVTLIRSPTRLELLCLDPAPQLRQTLEMCGAAVFFSATLFPMEYYRELLGGEPGDECLQLPSPFPPENLAVLLNTRIRTHFKDRSATTAAVTESIHALIREKPGNYLVYLPSYEYLNQVQAHFSVSAPGLRQQIQRPGMSDAEREEFLRAFAADHSEPLVGWAVLGGLFGEAVDLVGERLIGVVVVGVGLPQLCPERDLIRDLFQARQEDGFAYAYTFPGMNRVLQAVGRVIRSDQDRGVVLLIDTRYREPRYQQLLPAWWRPRRVASAQETAQAVRTFWAGPSSS